jgi:hypothetical protein
VRRLRSGGYASQDPPAHVLQLEVLELCHRRLCKSCLHSRTVTRAQLHALERILRELHDDGITNSLWSKHDESSARFPEDLDTNTMLNHDRYRMTFAGHGDSRTTKLYDRHGQKASVGGYGENLVPTAKLRPRGF